MRKAKTLGRERLIIAGALAVVAGFICCADLPAQKAAPGDAQDIVFLAKKRPVLMRLHIQIDGKPHRQVWNNYVREMFQRFDTDKNGSLDKTEAAIASSAMNAQPVQRFRVPLLGVAAKPASIMDRDDDGKVTMKEYAAQLRSNGTAAFQIQSGSGPAFPNGIVLINAAGNLNRTSTSAEALNKALLKLLDTNKDGKLSRQELKAAPKALLRRDIDEDEMVTPEEIQGEAGSNSGAYGLAIVDRPLVPPTGNATPNPFIAVSSDNAKDVARRMIQFYSAKGKTATFVLPREIKLDEKAFRSLDKDNNMRLDAAELAEFVKRTPDVDLVVRLGKNKGVKLVEFKGKPAEKVFKALGRDSANFTFGAGIEWVHLNVQSRNNSGFPQVRLNNAQINKQLYQAVFNSADRDKNGYLDKNESMRSQLASSFEGMDADRDGKVFEKEMFAYMKQTARLRAKAEASCTTLSVTEKGRGFFDLLDTNRDGLLSIREMRAAVGQVDKLDKDNDGAVAAGEIPRHYDLNLKQGSTQSSPIIGRVAVLAQGSNMAPQRRPAQYRGPRWFLKMDRNGDGDISPREFLGTIETFRRLDTDGDGLINVQEAERQENR